MLSNMRPEVLDRLARQQKDKILQEAVQEELAQRLLTKTAKKALEEESALEAEAAE